MIAVTDLGAARSTFRDTLGFTLKPGRVHENGLENVHVRFSDGSALELMAVGEGRPDRVSERYARFLARGEGGAFVALRAGPIDSVLGRLGELAVEAEVFEGRAFDWLSFPAGHPLHSLFFVHVRVRPPDEPAHLHHQNGTERLAEVWLEVVNQQGFAQVLDRFGASPCGEIEGPMGVIGQGYGLAGGTLVGIPIDPARGSGRILTVVLDGKRALPPVQSAGVWLRWRAAVP